MLNWKRLSDYWIKSIKPRREDVRKLFLLLVVLWKFTAVSAVEVFRDTAQIQEQLTDTLDVDAAKANVTPHSPHKATIYAMVLPGLGQVYNRQWWKLPILYGGVGATVYGISWNSRNFKKYKNAYFDYSHYLEEKAKIRISRIRKILLGKRYMPVAVWKIFRPSSRQISRLN